MPSLRDCFAETYIPEINSIVVAGGSNPGLTTVYNDLYFFNLTSRTWRTVSSNIAGWSAVMFINAVYSPASGSVHMWSGADASYYRKDQLLTVHYLGNTSVSTAGVVMDSYTGTAVRGNIVFYGGHNDQYYNTVYRYQPTATALTLIGKSPTSLDSLPVNTNAALATTESTNGTYLWMYNGQNNDMGITRLLLDGSLTYSAVRFTLTSASGMPPWDAGFPSMSCLVNKLWYHVRYSQAPDPSSPMIYSSYIFDLSDDSMPKIINWTITGTAPPNNGDNVPNKVACTASAIWYWDGLSRELWSINITDTQNSLVPKSTTTTTRTASSGTSIGTSTIVTSTIISSSLTVTSFTGDHVPTGPTADSSVLIIVVSTVSVSFILIVLGFFAWLRVRKTRRLMKSLAIQHYITQLGGEMGISQNELMSSMMSVSSSTDVTVVKALSQQEKLSHLMDLMQVTFENPKK